MLTHVRANRNGLHLKFDDEVPFCVRASLLLNLRVTAARTRGAHPFEDLMDGIATPFLLSVIYHNLVSHPLRAEVF